MKRFSFKMLAVAAAVCAVCWLGCGGDDNNPSNNTSHTHDWGAWEVTTPATCDAAGVETRTCKLDASHKETRVIPKLTGEACNPSETVLLGGLKWMTKNLNVETANSWCYGQGSGVFVDGESKTLTPSEIQANCNMYGRLYTWEAAKSACQSIGMRLPTKDEWSTLVTAAGGEETAGNKLKATNGWNDDGNGTNETRFSALPGGRRENIGAGIYDGYYFYSAGYYGYWWTATEKEIDSMNDYAYYRGIDFNIDYVAEFYNVKDIGYSVRCVQD